jgi:hypothetical protein
MVHDSGVSREKRRDSGQGNEDVGGCESISGAFCESARAVVGGMWDGGDRRLTCDIVAIYSSCIRTTVRVCRQLRVVMVYVEM